MTNRRGLTYSIETRANLAGLDSFTKKIQSVQAAWDDLKKSSQTLKLGATKGNLEAIGKQVPKLKAVARYLRDINKSLTSIQSKSRRSAAYFRLMNTKANQARVSVERINKAAARTKVELRGAANEATTLGDRLKRAVAISGRILAIYAGFQIVKGVITGMKDAVLSAFKFTDSIQKAEIGIRSLLVTMLEVRDAQGNVLNTSEAFAKSTAEARRQTALLRNEGLKTAATFQQLVDTYQVALGPGLAAGLDLDEIRRVTVLVSQAASAIGVPQDQLSEEIRALFTGSGSERTTRIAKQVLNISREAILSAREAGTLMTLLEEKLGGFGESGTATLETMSAQLINLGDIAKQSLGQGLIGSFEKLKGIFKDMNAYLGQGDGDIITLNPDVLELFEAVNGILEEMVDRTVAFGKSINLDGVVTALQSLQFIGSVVVDIFSVMASAVGNVLGILLGVVNLTVKVVKGFGLILNGSVLWKAALAAAELILTIIVGQLTLMGLRTAFVTAQLVLQKALLVAQELLIIAAYTAMGVLALATGGFTKALKAARVVLATIAGALSLPMVAAIAAVSAAVTLLIAFLNDDFGPQLTAAFSDIWAGIVLSAKTAFIELEGFWKKLVVRMKDFAGIDLGVDNMDEVVKAFEAMSQATNELDLAKAQGASAGAIAGLEHDLRSLQDALQDTYDAGKKLTLEDALKGIETDTVSETSKAVLDSSFSGDFAGSLVKAWESVSGSVKDLFKFDFGDDDGDAIVTFTSKFTQAKEALAALIVTAEKANDELALSEAQFGLEELEKTSAALNQKLNISIRDITELGSRLENDMVASIKKINDIPLDLRTAEESALLNALTKNLEDVRKKLKDVEAIRKGVLGTQLAAQAQADANARVTRNRSATEEIAQIREIAAIRQQVIDRNLTAEEGSTKIKLTQARQAHDLTIARIEKERAFLLAQSNNYDFLYEDRLKFHAASEFALVEINKLETLYTEQLKESNEELRKQALLKENPVAFGEEEFLDGLKTKNQIIAQGTQDLLQGFNDGLVNVLGDSLVDALFSKENTIRDKWEALMKDLAEIAIKTFFESQLAELFLSFGGHTNNSSVGPTGPVMGKAFGGKIGNRGAASMAHFGKSAQAFNRGGRPAGLPSSDTVPAWLTPGEWVTKLSSARMYGDQVMGMLNDGAIDPMALRALAGASGRSSSRRRKAMSLSSKGYATGGSVAGSAAHGGSGGVTVLNQLDETSLTAIMAGKAGERVVHNHLLSLGVIV